MYFAFSRTSASSKCAIFAQKALTDDIGGLHKGVVLACHCSHETESLLMQAQRYHGGSKKMTFSLFMQHMANAISLGSIYALIAIGYTIVYGILGLINMAHGSFFMVAAMLGAYGVLKFSLPWPISLLLAAAATAIVGIAVEKAAYKPLRGFKMSAFTSTVAVSFFLENLFVILFTGRTKPFPCPTFIMTVLHFGDIALPMVTLFVIVISATLFLILAYLVTRTKRGRAMRALSKDFEATMLMGVDTDKVISFSFAISALFAAAGAFMWCFQFPSVDPFMGLIPGLKAFIAAVMGGIGSIPGALLGGLFLGFAEIMLIAFLPSLSGWRDVFTYVLLILFLLFRPGGIFNVKLREEKV